MTYRIGAHSTSDDDSKYREQQAPEEGWDSERAYWEARSPVIRFGRYLAAKGWYNVQMEEAWRAAARKEAISALNDAVVSPRPAAKHLFTDVYDSPPWMQAEQQRELSDHYGAYRDSYPALTDRELDGL